MSTERNTSIANRCSKVNERLIGFNACFKWKCLMIASIPPIELRVSSTSNPTAFLDPLIRTSAGTSVAIKNHAVRAGEWVEE
jgi:hypothetical protein